MLPAESIRRVRILLLRATHLPFVALIRAYESITSRGYLASSPAGNTTSTPTTFHTRRNPGHAPARSEGPLALGPGPGSGSGSGRARTKAGESSEARGPGPEQAGRDGVELAGVIDEVDQLRIQVDRVAALLAVGRRH